MKKKNNRPSIPKKIQSHLWLRAGGRCEFRGCNKILYEDNITQDPINGSNIAHIISWTQTGPRGDKELSAKHCKDIDNLMLLCPEHNHLIDSEENIEKYTVSILQEMKREHENAIRKVTDLINQNPVKVIELRDLIHGQVSSITNKEEADALFPFYYKSDKIVIDVSNCDEIETAVQLIKSIVNKQIISDNEDDTYALFAMARISLGCYLGYLIGSKVSCKSFQRFRDTEDWKWREGDGGFINRYPNILCSCENINLFINVSGQIDKKLVINDYPTFIIDADTPGFDFLQSWEQVIDFRCHYREMLNRIRNDFGENVTIHLYPATPNPINFEIGKNIMKNLDPTIVLYDKSDHEIVYKKQMHLHDRIR